MFTVRIFSSMLPQLITTQTMLDDKYYCEIVWDFIQNNYQSAVEFEGLPMIVASDMEGTARTLSLSRLVNLNSIKLSDLQMGLQINESAKVLIHSDLLQIIHNIMNEPIIQHMEGEQGTLISGYIFISASL